MNFKIIYKNLIKSLFVRKISKSLPENFSEIYFSYMKRFRLSILKTIQIISTNFSYVPILVRGSPIIQEKVSGVDSSYASICIKILKYNTRFLFKNLIECSRILL